MQKICNDLFYLGSDDRTTKLFENVYPIPQGVSYNSYLLIDDRTVLFDTADASVREEFFSNLQEALGGRKLDYLVVHHVEPDHSACFSELVEKYPSVTVVTSKKGAMMLKNFYGYEGAALEVGEGSELKTKNHTLRFVAAPMVHWPEVIFSFDEQTGTLFSADAFGTFRTLDGKLFADDRFEEDYLDEARRYYCNIVGKYGAQVQAVLKKAAALPIGRICPLHGPVWETNIGWFVEKYRLWSAYEAEEKGVVIFAGTVYGHTLEAGNLLKEELAKRKIPATVYDVSSRHVSYFVAEAFRYSFPVFASATYNNGIFDNMARLIDDLKAHNFQNRAYALIENGSWAPQAGKLMEAELSALKNMRKVGETVTVLSALKEEGRAQIARLAEEIALEFAMNSVQSADSRKE